MRDKIINKIISIKDNKCNSMNTIIKKPEKIFKPANANSSDLIVHFDDLYWKSLGKIEYDSIYLDDNDIGPDAAAHDWFGIYFIYDPIKKLGKNLDVNNILDIAPTSLNVLSVKILKDMEGNLIKF
jgi:predicted AlkP superfamily phosphohydrolase/phosphomutase